MEFLQNALAYIVDLGSYIFVPILMMFLKILARLCILVLQVVNYICVPIKRIMSKQSRKG